MKKCHFTHALCPLVRAVKNWELCFSQTFWLEVSSEDMGKVTEHPFAPHASRNCSTRCCWLKGISAAVLSSLYPWLRAGGSQGALPQKRNAGALVMPHGWISELRRVRFWRGISSHKILLGGRINQLRSGLRQTPPHQENLVAPHRVGGLKCAKWLHSAACLPCPGAHGAGRIPVPPPMLCRAHCFPVSRPYGNAWQSLTCEIHSNKTLKKGWQDGNRMSVDSFNSEILAQAWSK